MIVNMSKKCAAYATNLVQFRIISIIFGIKAGKTRKRYLTLQTLATADLQHRQHYLQAQYDAH